MRTTRSLRSLSALALAAVAAITSIQGAAPMPRATPESVGMSGERLQAATALLRQFVAHRRIVGAVDAVGAVAPAARSSTSTGEKTWWQGTAIDPYSVLR